MKQSEKLKLKHNELAKKIKELDSIENPSSEQTEEAEKRFIELEQLGKKISRQLALEAIATGSPTQDIPQKELKKYSLAKALSYFGGKLEGREKEVHQELAKHTPRRAEQQVLVPIESILRKPEQRAVGGQSSLVSDPLKPELFQYSLRESSLMDKLGIERISAKGNFNYPKNSNTTSSNWFSGTGGNTAQDKIAESDMTFTSESVVPHYLSTRSGYTWDQIHQMAGNLSLEEKIRSDIQMNLAESLDDAFLNADSAADSAAPDGLLKLLTGKNNQAVNLTSSVKFKLQDFVDVRKRFREQYKNNMASPVYLLSALAESELAIEQKFNQSDGDSLLESIGPYFVTGHLADTKILYGAFNEFIFTTFGGLSIEKGYMNNDFELGVSRIRAILSCSFTLDREQGFQQLTITRTG